jgi:hypothetical protein
LPPASIKRFALALFLMAMRLPGLAQPPANTPVPVLAPSFANGQSDLAYTTWLFHSGDDPSLTNPAFASPNFDDSAWQRITPSTPMAQYAPVQTNTVAWYRLHLRIPAGASRPAIQTFSIARAYQFWINGNRVAQFGGAPGHEYPTFEPVEYYDLPVSPSQPTDVVLAFRCVLLGNSTTLTHPLIGPGKLTLGRREDLLASHQRDILSFSGPYYALNFLQLLVGLLALYLYRSQPSQRDYLWIAMLAFQQVLQGALNIADNSIPMERDLSRITQALLDGALCLLYLFFYADLRRHHIRFWKQIAYVGALGIAVLEILNGETSLLPDSITTALFVLCWVPLLIYPFITIRQIGWGDRREGVLMLIPFSMLGLDFLFRFGSEVLVNFGLLHHLPALMNGVVIGGIRIDSGFLANTIFWVSIPAIIVYRSTLLSQENARVAADLEAARRVQALLVPSTPPATPGFLVETVYLPAQEVGGDFFLVSPAPDNSLLLVVGDVSGKGIQAALVVSTIVGILRNEPSREPATVLAHLNRALAGVISGFATGLCAHISATGALTIANAGHLSPYLNGADLELPGALPLGLAAEAEYDSTTRQLTPGTRLVFVSDGVIEAESPTRELLGFDRAREFSLQPADAIAQAARTWGQSDDITVVAITWQPAF